MYVRFIRVFIVAILVALAGCASQVNTDHDPAIDFSSLKKFYFFPQSQTLRDDFLVTEMELDRVRSALLIAFKESHKRVASMYESDFVLSYYVVVEPEYSYSSHGNYSGAPLFSDHGRWHSRFSEKVYMKGALIVDVYDTKSSKMIWRGTVSTGLKRQQPPEQREEKISKAVNKLTQRFLSLNKS